MVFLAASFLAMSHLQENQPQQVLHEADLLSVGDFIKIDKINVWAPIIFVNTVDEKEFQQALRKGVVHYPGTAMPGENGNCYVFGHSSDVPFVNHPYKAIFVDLPNLKIGDKITIYHNQKHHSYKVLNSKVVEADDLSVLSQETSGEKLLTLQTSYPIGTAKQRFIVIAEIK